MGCACHAGDIPRSRTGEPAHDRWHILNRRWDDRHHVKPLKLRRTTAHISRVVIEENGEELQIVRHSFPYGTTSESGLFVIAYSKKPDIPEKMLKKRISSQWHALLPGKAKIGLRDSRHISCCF
ncbi:MAG: Dyp-type peroxidase [Deltaproteobacteria bacterium]|nr:Dyp-type peroxidase [Deltaproteobacteria bacterium]